MANKSHGLKDLYKLSDRKRSNKSPLLKRKARDYVPYWFLVLFELTWVVLFFGGMVFVVLMFIEAIVFSLFDFYIIDIKGLVRGLL